MHLLKRHARDGYLKDITEDQAEADGRCPLCHRGLHPNLGDAEDFRTLRRLIHRHYDRRNKRLEATWRGEQPKVSAEENAAQDNREFQQLLEDHHERIRRRGQPPSEKVD